MITPILLIVTITVQTVALGVLLFFYFRLQKKYNIISDNPQKAASQMFADLVASGRGLFYIEKLDERDVFIRRT